MIKILDSSKFLNEGNLDVYHKIDINRSFRSNSRLYKCQLNRPLLISELIL